MKAGLLFECLDLPCWLILVAVEVRIRFLIGDLDWSPSGVAMAVLDLIEISCGEVIVRASCDFEFFKVVLITVDVVVFCETSLPLR